MPKDKDEQEKTICPCTWGHPCNPRCTCVCASSSRGCTRCCTYGSEEQRKAMAAWIAERLGRAEG
jgi:hypothetical protein